MRVAHALKHGHGGVFFVVENEKWMMHTGFVSNKLTFNCENIDLKLT